MSNPGQKPVVLVTGSSTGGIGFELCQKFAPYSHVVYATARRLESMTGFTSDNIKPLELDVCSDESVGEAVRKVIEAEGRIDVVVSNAGAMALGPLLDVSTRDAQASFDVNFFGTHRLVHAIVPGMIARRSGRVIIVGSITGELPGPWHGTYSAPKAALHNFAEVLMMECAPFNVKIQLVIPGSVRSNISKNQANRFVMREDSLYKQYAGAVYKRMTASQGSHATPTDEFAALVVKEALRPEPKQRLFCGGLMWLFLTLLYLPRSWAFRFVWWAQKE